MKDIAIQKYNELTSGLTQGYAQRTSGVNGLLHNASYFNGIMHIHAVQVTEQLVQQWVEDEKTTITYVERRTSKFTNYTTFPTSYVQTDKPLFVCTLQVCNNIFYNISALTDNWKPAYFTLLQSFYSTRY